MKKMLYEGDKIHNILQAKSSMYVGSTSSLRSGGGAGGNNRPPSPTPSRTSSTSTTFSEGKKSLAGGGGTTAAAVSEKFGASSVEAERKAGGKLGLGITVLGSL